MHAPLTYSELHPPRADLILNLCLQKAQISGWEKFSLNGVYSPDISSQEVFSLFKKKEDVLRAHFSKLDQTIQQETYFEEGFTLQDKIFEVIIVRLEHLQPYKKFISELQKLSVKNLCLGAHLASLQNQSIIVMMNKLYATPPINSMSTALFHKALWGLYFATLQKWISNANEGVHQTMGFLGQTLERIMPIFQALD